MEKFSWLLSCAALRSIPGCLSCAEMLKWYQKCGEEAVVPLGIFFVCRDFK
jgi:hypothetical protein